jgi:dipeptidase E
MKLLLTSAGITNNTLVNTLKNLLAKPFSESCLTFITTAANPVPGDKSWLIKDFVNLQNLGFKEIDILDISSIPKANWLPRIEKADVIVVGGGDEFYLLDWVNKTGLKELLPKLLKTKVYIGISAGSMIMTDKLSYEISEKIFEEKVDDSIYKNNSLGYIDFQICPHYKSKEFTLHTAENIINIARDIKQIIYAIDDNTAIQVLNGEVEVLSEGEWEKFS